MDGQYTMTSIVSLYMDLRNQINKVAMKILTERQVKKYRDSMLQKIDQKLENFETSVSRVHVVGADVFRHASKAFKLLKKRQEYLNILYRTLNNPNFYENFDGNNDKEIRLKDLDLVQDLFHRFKDMESVLSRLRVLLGEYRMKVKESTDFHEQSWFEWNPQVLMGKFESILKSVQDELEQAEDPHFGWIWGVVLGLFLLGLLLK